MSSKLREALNQLLGLIDNEILVFSNELDPSEVSNAQYQIDKADEALAEPLRNCEAGTAEEQEERYLKLKREHVDKLARCPAVGPSFFPDSLYWAQMPYKEVK